MELLPSFEAFLQARPTALEEALRQYMEGHGNLKSDLGLRQLFERFAEARGRYYDPRRLSRIGGHVEQVCRELGVASGPVSRAGHAVHELPLRSLSPERYAAWLEQQPVRSASANKSALHLVMDFGVKQKLIETDITEGIVIEETYAERMARQRGEVAINTNAQYQIALDMAAGYTPEGRPTGYFVTVVVLLYIGALRPDSELTNILPTVAQMSKGVLRIRETKQEGRRIKRLPPFAIAMLRRYWDGKPLNLAGWKGFWKRVQRAQGYDVAVPRWFKAPPPTLGKPEPDVPRHTGASHSVNWSAFTPDCFRDNGHSRRVFLASYDGLVTTEETAQFCSQLPRGMSVSDEERDAQLRFLQHAHLIAPDETIPAPLLIEAPSPTPPPRAWPLPPVPDAELARLAAKGGLSRLARTWKMSPGWLSAVLVAKGIRVKWGRGQAGQAGQPDDRLPEALRAMDHAELARLIEQLHGIEPAARHLGGMQAIHLSAYCAVHQIPVPSQAQLMRHYNSRPRVWLGRETIEAALKTQVPEEVAARARVPVDTLIRYCQRHHLELHPAAARADDRDRRVLHARIRQRMRASFGAGAKPDLPEALLVLLGEAPHGLPLNEARDLLEQGVGLALRVGALAAHIRKDGRFILDRDQLQLAGAAAREPSLTVLRERVLGHVGQARAWPMLAALEVVVGVAGGRISPRQLLELLPEFGVVTTRPALEKELRAWDRIKVIRYFAGTITLPCPIPPWRLQGLQREPTPGVEDIRSRVVADFAGLAHQDLGNVPFLNYVLSFAPDGLWQAELATLAQALGRPWAEGAIHSVAHDLAPEEFRCERGRVKLVGTAIPRLHLADLDRLVPEAAPPFVALLERLLSAFPAGLEVDELLVAASRKGHRATRDTFRRRLYNLAGEGCLRVERARVFLVRPFPAWQAEGLRHEPTPGFDSIRQATIQGLGQLVLRRLSNLDLLCHLLAHAPDGLLWTEVMELARAVGAPKSLAGLESVVQHAGKERFRCKGGRVRLVGDAPARLRWSDVNRLIPGTTAPWTETLETLLRAFPGGLSVDELHAAAERKGEQLGRKTFRMRLERLAHQGRLHLQVSSVRWRADPT